jgi:heme/copper-type cytochrome/quinol oxidase subunit 3
MTISSTGSDAIANTKNNVLKYTVTGTHSSHVWLGLYSCAGRLVAQSEITGSSGSMSLTNVIKGAYVAVLKSGQELLSQKTVIVR